MDYVARFVKFANWEPVASPICDVSSDAAACLRTSSQGLSVWICDLKQPATIEDVALANAVTRENFEKLQIVLLERSVLENAGFSLMPTEGSTFVAELRGRHLDVVNLTLADLPLLGTTLSPFVRAETSRRTFTTAAVKELVLNAARAGRIEMERIKPALRKKIDEALAKEAPAKG